MEWPVQSKECLVDMVVTRVSLKNMSFYQVSQSDSIDDNMAVCHKMWADLYHSVLSPLDSNNLLLV